MKQETITISRVSFDGAIAALAFAVVIIGRHRGAIGIALDALKRQDDQKVSE
jgi:hypothetical protein